MVGLVRTVTWLVGTAGLFLLARMVVLSLLVWGLRAAFQVEEGVVTVGQTMTAFAIFWALLPAVVGGAWCYRYWLPALRRSAGKSPNSLREALEPRQGVA